VEQAGLQPRHIESALRKRWDVSKQWIVNYRTHLATDIHSAQQLPHGGAGPAFNLLVAFFTRWTEAGLASRLGFSLFFSGYETLRPLLEDRSRPSLRPFSSWKGFASPW
jgi:hypothetical protein